MIPLAYQILGYTGSVLVAVALMMASIIKLRIISLCGATCFAIYGLAIKAYPVAGLNFLIILIHCYHLYDAFTAKEYFKILAVRPESDYLRYFLNFYDHEIKHFLPDFLYRQSETQLTFFILRDMVPAGLFIAEPQAGDTLFIKIDFVIPGYRDFKIGRFLFAEKAEVFKERGVRKISSAPGSPKHEAYLRSMGFVPESSMAGERLYSLMIA
ncbi:hypothetical protein L0337_33340 [candidate division KSB1 bacterium]|nr:hypothetical protein [candidate division KSB1 bacterium]